MNVGVPTDAKSEFPWRAMHVKSIAHLLWLHIFDECVLPPVLHSLLRLSLPVLLVVIFHVLHKHIYEIKYTRSPDFTFQVAWVKPVNAVSRDQLALFFTFYTIAMVISRTK